LPQRPPAVGLCIRLEIMVNFFLAERPDCQCVQYRFYEEVGKAIWGYLADKLNIEISDLTKDFVTRELAEGGIGDELLDEFSRILDESEFSRFAPSSEKADVEKLYRDAVQLVRNLENSL